MGDKKRLVFLVFLVVMVGAAAYVWYPRLFPKKAAVRPSQVLREPPVQIEEAPQKPENPAVQVPPPGMAKPPAPQVVAKAAKEHPRERAAAAPVTPRRYGLEFPPLVTVAEADEYERRLKEAGLPTLRATTSIDDGLYMLIIGPFPSVLKASEAMTELRPKTVPSSPREAEGGFVFSDGPYVLREVVQRAQEIRGKGYGVRIVQGEGKAPLYVIRTAARLDSAQANKLSGHYQKLGFPNQVVAGR